MKHIVNSSGHNIFIFDDVFVKEEVEHFAGFCENSKYSVRSKSTDLIEHLDALNLQCMFTENDLKNFRFFESPNTKKFMEYLGDRKLVRCWTLMSSYLSKYYLHTDRVRCQNGRSLLFYANPFWNPEWVGGTIFANDFGESEIIVEYRPNRVVIFDSHIPHKPAPTTADSTQYRFSFVAQFM